MAPELVAMYRMQIFGLVHLARMSLKLQFGLPSSIPFSAMILQLTPGQSLHGLETTGRWRKPLFVVINQRQVLRINVYPTLHLDLLCKCIYALYDAEGSRGS